MSQPGESRILRLNAEDIPRLIYLTRVLRLCLFPVATVLLGDIVLLFVPQARETLRAFGDGSRFVSQIIALWVAYALWMVSAWYVARLLLGRRFQPDLVGICRSPVFAQQVARWLPRSLAVLAALPVPINLLRDPGLRLTGALLILTGALVLLGLVFRRQWAQSRQDAWVARWQAEGPESIARFEQLSMGAWSFITALFLVSFGLLAALLLGMETVARPIGSPALLLFALMSWAIFGGFVLTYLPKSLGYPEITWLLLIVVAVFARWNENHYVARGTGAQNALPQPISTVFAQWLARRPDPQAPVIFIAAAGGASRAAFWTTSALGLLEDESRSHAYPLSTNTFLISGVSGGSVGATTFVTAVDLAHRTAASSASCHSVRHLGDAFTGRDDLATVIGLWLFPDTFQRFLPFPIVAWDRSRGLEEVWGRDWAAVMARCPVQGTSANPWTRPLTDLYSASSSSPELPILALNSTAMNAGLPVLQANFQLSRAEVVQIFSPQLATRTLTLAQAAHNSARFPYVSPAGVVQMTSPVSPAGAAGSAKLLYWDRLGDGGYVEASGTFMVAEVLRELSRAGLIRDATSPGECNRADPRLEQNCFVTRRQIHVVILDNTPTTGTAYLCARNGTGSSTLRPGLPQNSIVPGDEAWPPVADATFPILGAFRTQGGRGEAAQLDLLGLVGGCTEQFAELRMPKPADGEAEPSMNWMLSGASRKFINQVLSKPDGSQGDAYVQLSQNLARVRSWFGPAGPAR
ncbi:MAG: hypothetical protein ACREVO_04410 [Steroidobacteraceae bacterium]